MAKFDKKIEARRLRKDGWSIGNIAIYLKVSKSSVSIWCRDIEMTNEQKEKFIADGHLGRLLGAETNRRKKQQCIEQCKIDALKTIGKLSRRDRLIAGIALYWGEGSKKSKMSFVNSEPVLVLFMLNWFCEIMDVKKEEFMPRIFINEMHRPRADKVLEFWADYLGLKKEQFGKIVFLKMKAQKVYENHDNYYGVLALGARNSALLKYRILGLIDALKI
ncbi:MAG: hypothetical protein ACD_81C00188G0017 [uncultured bacterium]|uniref:Resolvase helix-turn-helix domain protein n=1 Tax=Candidatus Wolfebacteria bacterium GW2011_GWC2_39_22 TaxID=1619013 RepID=A0A0G0QR45_9BACT|nr:MAG: hypothetical protein ACD_81C00188G0017 [uncultured bacterium]KKR12860.1 MAG: hypothetical protein UT41_C0001G0404 [Candidatus Wolfebacteria bacterium GW2011_GWC2_39_22]HBI25479.1 hypothetical protein [Candidatus Wolfebacteria bacterium]